MDFQDIQTFDARQSYSVFWRRLPHWTQAGTICFITFRTADSMPRETAHRWIVERNRLLREEGIVIDAADRARDGAHWKTALRQLPRERQASLHFLLTTHWDIRLDECHGACVLRTPALAAIVADSLRKFDGERYDLTNFVVMPNHVHLLAAFRDEETMLAQCSAWKRFTARAINQHTCQSGAFWQVDAFDHLVRSPAYFERYRGYIAENGPRAGLSADEYLHYSKT
jgi:type I restriction enzyme R subunit